MVRHSSSSRELGTLGSANSNERLDFVFAGAIGASAVLMFATALGAFVWQAINANGSIELPTLLGVSGDFLSGVLGPLLSLVSTYFVVMTLRDQRETSSAERRAEVRERFETRFFELLRLHRDNVEEMELQGIKGRRIFVLMLDEWRCGMNVVRKLAQSEGAQLNQSQLLHIAYYVLFFGVGPNSNRMLKTALGRFDEAFVDEVIATFDYPTLKGDVAKDKQLPYFPFEGHQSRLGHYYRHLFQTVRYVEKNAPMEIPKEDYTRTIRAQLSTHEQAFLLLNSLTPMGAEWWNLRLIDTYSLVHNIPQSFFEPDLELNPATIFENKDYFEIAPEHENRFASLEHPFHRFYQPDTDSWTDGVPIG